MPAPSTVASFLDIVRRSGLLEEQRLNRYLSGREDRADDVKELAADLVRDGLLTRFQADQLQAGRTRGFTISGKYRLLEHLGAGGMGSVFLCEHMVMRRRVAIKILPVARANDASYLERFHREARAVAALDHPNIVRAHDVDFDGKLHFLVMEYVDGSNLFDIVRQHGPLDPTRAAHYLKQAAAGLQHAHEAGLVHRDIKPANILIDRTGTVKVLDMGLARFFHEDNSLSKKYDESILGTTDYLAPEQTLDSNVDVRADIYSLGATFYHCLTGQTLFGEGQTAQKMIWHQTRQPRPIRSLRPEVPEELANLIEKKLLAKDPAQRFQVPAEVVAALEPLTRTPIPPPPAEEMPNLCPAARGSSSDPRLAPMPTGGTPVPPGRSSISGSKSWTVSGFPRTDDTSKPVEAQRDTVPVPPTDEEEMAKAPTVKRRKTPMPARKADPRQGPITKLSRRPASRGDVEPDEEEDPPSKKSPSPSGIRKRKLEAAPPTARRLWIAGAALLAVLLIGGAGGAFWWYRSRTPAANEPRAAQKPAPPQERSAPPVAAPPKKPAADVAVATVGDERRIRARAYEATVASDGCMTSLRVGGVELLNADLRFSRGTYFHQQGTEAALVLPILNHPKPNVLTARGDRASIRYELGADAMTWTVANATTQPMSFFFVFAPAVTAVVGPASEDGAETAPPLSTREWPDVTVYAGTARLKITGANRIWPWFGKAQVCQVSLASQEKRTLHLEAGTVSQAEAERVAAAARAPRPKAPRPLRRVRTERYEAFIEPDGCLTSLRVGGTELFWKGGKIARGSYFYQDKGAGTLKLPQITQPADNEVHARGPLASIRYTFTPDSLTWKLSNDGKEPLAFYIVFDPAVRVVMNDKGAMAKTPVRKRWTTTTWLADRARLTITGGSEIWGPWEGPHQVWATHLKGGEKKQVVLKVEPLTEAEAARVAKATGVKLKPSADLTLMSPQEYQVFQRQSRQRGVIRLQGKVKPACDRLEVRLRGKSLEGPLPEKWQPVSLEPDRSFDTELPAAAGGWYEVAVRALKGDKVVAHDTVEHVGVGEVFVVAGQSNSTNCSQEKLKQESGMVATFGGQGWRLANDPQPGVHDSSSGGSPWPAFGDALYAKLHVPIGIASTGHAGTSVKAWQPGGELFDWMLTRMRELGPHGFRAVLWHQGESDVGMSSDEYARLLTTVIQESKKQAGWDFPWFVAQVSYQNPYNRTFATTRNAQKRLWEQKVALEGPDTDTLTGDNRDNGGQGIHLSARGLRAHGKLWAEKVGAYLNRELARPAAK